MAALANLQATRHVKCQQCPLPSLFHFQAGVLEGDGRETLPPCAQPALPSFSRHKQFSPQNMHVPSVADTTARLSAPVDQRPALFGHYCFLLSTFFPPRSLLPPAPSYRDVEA
jgi:hypothetical protein